MALYTNNEKPIIKICIEISTQHLSNQTWEKLKQVKPTEMFDKMLFLDYPKVLTDTDDEKYIDGWYIYPAPDYEDRMESDKTLLPTDLKALLDYATDMHANMIELDVLGPKVYGLPYYPEVDMI